MAHVRTQGGDEGCISGFAQPVGDQGQQAPILPLEIDLIGRRTDAGVERIERLIDPGLGAALVDAHGQILIDPDLETELQRTVTRCPKLEIRLPL
jgi:hypothetical protein